MRRITDNWRTILSRGRDSHDGSIDRSVGKARVDDRALIINPYNRRFKGGTNRVGGSRSYASRRCGIELAAAMVKIDFSIKSFATLVTRPAKLPGTSSLEIYVASFFTFFCPRLYTNFFFLFLEMKN